MVKTKEEKKEQRKKYDQSEKGKKSRRIKDWKRIGVICSDFDSLYQKYIDTKNCEECKREFGQWGDGSGSFRCLDHNHESGQFRNIICCSCNVKRR